MQITAEMVKTLRDKTDAGMMDCKRALKNAEGDMEKAVEEMRKAGVAKAAKKAGRVATEGVVRSCIDDNVASMVEVLCETDFVARNEKFSAYADDLAKRVGQTYAEDGDVSDRVAAAEKEAVGELVAAIGENIQVRRAVRWTRDADSAFATYLHMDGRIGVLADIAGTDDEELRKDICMHIAAFNPRFITPDEIPADVIDNEKEIARAQVEGKPAHILDKIIEGKIRKWYTEVCLTQQPWLRDDKTSLAKLAPSVRVHRFVRWAVGEEVAEDEESE